MKRFFKPIIFVFLVLLIALSSLLIFCMKSNSFHQFVISRVNESIPGSLSLGKLKLNLAAMRLELRDVELKGADGNAIARFKRFMVDVSAWSLFKRKVIAGDIILDDPWIDIAYDSSGNLTVVSAFQVKKEAPKDTTKKESDFKLFPIEVKSLKLNGGSGSYSIPKDEFKVHADGLSVEAKAKTAIMWADVLVGLDSVLIELSGKESHIRQISLMAIMDDFKIDTVDFKMSTDKSSVGLSGKTGSLKEELAVDIGAELNLSLNEIDSILGLGKKIDGFSKIKLSALGKVTNPELNLDVACKNGNVWGYQLNNLFLKSYLEDRKFNFKRFRIGIGDGSVGVTGGVDLQEVFPKGFLSSMSSLQNLKYKLSVFGAGVSISEFAPSVKGIADVSVGIDGNGVKPDSLNAQVVMSVGVRDFSPSSQVLPFNSTIETEIQVLNGKADVKSMNIGVLDEIVSVNLNGGFDLVSEKINAQMGLSVKDLNTPCKIVKVDKGNGKIDLSVKIDGTMKAPLVNVNLNAKSLKYDKICIGDISLNAQLDNNGKLTLDKLVLTNDSSRIEIGAIASVLNKGVPLPVDMMNFGVSIFSEHLFVENFIDSIQGDIKIKADIKGNINDLTGGLRVSLLDLIAANRHIPQVDLVTTFEGPKAKIEQLAINIGLTPKDIVLSGWAGLKDSFDLKVLATNLPISKLMNFDSGQAFDGVVALNIGANGSYKDPRADGRIDIKDILIEKKPIDNIVLNVNMLNKKVGVNGRVGGTLDAIYDLETCDFSAKLNLQNLLLESYLAILKQDLHGTISASIEAFGNTKSLEKLTGELNVSSLDLYYKELNVIETHNLNAKFQDKKYRVSDFAMKLVEEGEVSARAEGVLDGAHDAAVNGVLPLSIVRQFSPELFDIDGRVFVDATFSGKAEKSDLKADLRLDGVGMTLPGLSQRLHSLNGRILADQEKVRIEKISGKLDEGEINFDGELKLDKLAPSDLAVDIILSKLPVGVPDMLDVVFDAKLKLKGNPDTTSIEGDIVLLDGVYYQDIAINPFSGMGQRKRAEPVQKEDSNTPYLKNMKMDIGVQARAPFRVDNNLAQLTISPDLQLRGGLQSLSLNGRANVENGSITYLKKVFTVERGVIDFVNPYAIEAQVDILGKIPVQDRIITIVVSGSPDNMVFKLECDDPGLEDQDIISLLVLGMTTNELQNDASVGSGESTQQMLASLVASTFGEDIRNVTGLDMLEVETGNEDNENSDRIAVTVGKQLTRRLGTKYTVETESGEVLQRATAEYRMLQNLFIAGFQDTKGVFGGELRFSWQKR